MITKTETENAIGRLTGKEVYEWVKNASTEK